MYIYVYIYIYIYIHHKQIAQTSQKRDGYNKYVVIENNLPSWLLYMYIYNIYI